LACRSFISGNKLVPITSFTKRNTMNETEYLFTSLSIQSAFSTCDRHRGDVNLPKKCVGGS
jgi:hypothetical protein